MSKETCNYHQEECSNGWLIDFNEEVPVIIIIIISKFFLRE
jgi:hypothetical protein